MADSRPLAWRKPADTRRSVAVSEAAAIFKSGHDINRLDQRNGKAIRDTVLSRFNGNHIISEAIFPPTVTGTKKVTGAVKKRAD
jgi:hypothetical protein